MPDLPNSFQLNFANFNHKLRLIKKKKISNISTCSQCSYKYYEKYRKWPKKGKYKSIYKLTVIDDNYDSMIPQLWKHWYSKYKNADSKWVIEYKACERCSRHNRFVKEMMEYKPEGWTECPPLI
jgi:hypothetical protein